SQRADHVEAAAEQEAEKEDPARPARVALPMLLLQEEQLAPHVLGQHSATVRTAVDMCRDRRRIEPYLPARAAEAIRPVGLLAEEEERVVRGTDLVDRRAPDEPDGAHDPFRAARPIMVESACVERVERRAAL